MKDVIISAKRQKIEMLILAVCFLLACSINVTAILIYHTQWKELYSQWFVVVLTMLFLYALSWIVRLIYLGIKTAWFTLSKRK